MCAFQSDGGTGAIWILSLDSVSFNVVSKLKIAPGLAGFDETVSSDANPNGTSGAQFGHALAAVGDLNGDGITDIVTGANQYNEGYGYILYLNANKTVKSFSRINGTEGGFNLTLEPTERFSRSISYVGDNRQDGNLSINFGGGAGESGAIYQLKFDACDVELQAGNNFWADGTTYFSNWNHADQLVTNPLTFEQCAVHVYEHNAANMTYQDDGRCIVKDDRATLEASSENSLAYVRRCP